MRLTIPQKGSSQKKTVHEVRREKVIRDKVASQVHLLFDGLHNNIVLFDTNTLLNLGQNSIYKK